MATSEFRNKNLQRPKKSQNDQRKRLRVQQKRLIALGMAEAAVMKMTHPQIRAALRKPAKIKK
ncbi:MAG TPA: hypothetical protein PKK36_10810, partial [Kiritimatiellia bacterium]|nr:hypothetical protein [Kiritimatiellia bacterium]HPA78763.1 hypothetical protein [Kiritimatiellia bacterium]HQQ04959.1 hypothetical protein [Kiritimatiellia bacterium]